MLRNKLLKYFFKLKNSNNLAKQQRYKFKLNLYKQLAGAASTCICDIEPGLECSHCSQPGAPSKAPEQASKEEEDEPAVAWAAISAAHSASKIGKTSAAQVVPIVPTFNDSHASVVASHEPPKEPVEKLNLSLRQHLNGIFDEQNLLGYMHAFISDSVNYEFSCRLHPTKCIYYKEFEAYRDAHAKKMMQWYNYVMSPKKWEDYYDNGPGVTSENRGGHRSDEFDMISYLEPFDDATVPRYVSFHRDHTECFKNTFLQHRQYEYKIEGLRIQSYVNLGEICDEYLKQNIKVFSELEELHIGLQSHITSIPDKFPLVFPKLKTLVIEIGIEKLPESFSLFEKLRSLSIGFPMDISKLPIMKNVQFVEFIEHKYKDYAGRVRVKVPINTTPVMLKRKFPLLDTFTDAGAMCVGCKPTKKEESSSKKP